MFYLGENENGTSLSPEQELILVVEELIWVYCLHQVTLRNQHSKMLTLNSDLIEQLLRVNRSWDSSALCSSVLPTHNRLGSTRAFFIKQCFHLQLDVAYNCIMLWLEYKNINLLFCVRNVYGTGSKYSNLTSGLPICRTHILRQMSLMKLNAGDTFLY